MNHKGICRTVDLQLDKIIINIAIIIYNTSVTSCKINHYNIIRFLGAVKLEITDPRNRNKASCNIPKEQLVAIKELIKLQRDWKIIIKRFDKGAGIIILNFEEFLNVTYAHLNSTLTNMDGSTSRYYTKVDESTIDTAKK